VTGKAKGARRRCCSVSARAQLCRQVSPCRPAPAEPTSVSESSAVDPFGRISGSRWDGMDHGRLRTRSLRTVLGTTRPYVVLLGLCSLSCSRQPRPAPSPIRIFALAVGSVRIGMLLTTHPRATPPPCWRTDGAGAIESAHTLRRTDHYTELTERSELYGARPKLPGIVSRCHPPISPARAETISIRRSPTGSIILVRAVTLAA